MYICICNAVTEKQVRASVDAGATSLEDLHLDLGVAAGCGRCAATAAEYLPGGRCSTVCAPQAHGLRPIPLAGPVAGPAAANLHPMIRIAVA